MVYLCGRMIGDGYSMLGRETALDPVSWTADGWPVVNGLKGPSVLQKRPDLPVWMPEEEPDIGWNPKWMTPRAPEPEGIRFLSSGIRIKGSRFPLRDVAAIAETDFVLFYCGNGTCDTGTYRWSGSRFSLLL